MTEILKNLLIVAAAIVAFAVIAKSEGEKIRNWITKRWPSAAEPYDQTVSFWRATFKNLIAVLAVAVIIACQKNLVGMIIATVVLFGGSFLLAKFGLFKNALDPKNEKFVKWVLVAVAAVWLLIKVGLIKSTFLKGITTNNSTLWIVVAIAVVAIILTRKKKTDGDKPEKKEEEEEEVEVVEGEVVDEHKDN